jgi:hypothetical protein
VPAEHEQQEPCAEAVACGQTVSHASLDRYRSFQVLSLIAPLPTAHRHLNAAQCMCTLQRNLVIS